MGTVLQSRGYFLNHRCLEGAIRMLLESLNQEEIAVEELTSRGSSKD